MGVAGLWEVLRPAGQVRSLTKLAIEDGFNANPAHQRGFRIGIDASIWFFHATYGREGENPELRTLFFRCCRLLQIPLLPLFVFDGPNRPAIKRGKRVGGNAHWLTQGMKNIIDAFGFEWCVAPGEAEAELAYLNRIGVIDAVLSDDVDNFLFGATMVIRNPSNTLSGNRAHPVKNAQGKDDGNHVVTYTADAILSNSSVALSRSGTILIGLLSGGDYIPAGLPGCGLKFATGLARAGFGDSLVKAIKELKGPRLDLFINQWRQDIKNELKTNKGGLLPSKKPSLAASLPDDFPSLPVLLSYADPLTSENTPMKGNRRIPPAAWRNDPDPMRIASLCELYFEWGVKDIIVHRFRTVLWPGIVCRAVRRVVLEEDIRRHLSPAGTRHTGYKDEDYELSSPSKRLSSTLSTLALSSPSKKASASDSPVPDSFTLSSLVRLISPTSSNSSRSASPSSPACKSPPLLLEVLSHRTHASTDSTLEYRVLIDPTALVERAESGVKGLRPPLVGGLFGIDPEDENEDEDESASDDNSSSIERLETAANAASKSGKKRRKARREDPMKPLRLWLPACMVRAAAPVLADAYDEKVRLREEKKAKRGTKGSRGRCAGTGVKPTSRKTKANSGVDDDGGESVPGPSTPKKAVGSKVKSRAVRTGGGSDGRRRKLKQASEAQDDAYEFIDLNASGGLYSSDADAEENTHAKGKTRAGQTDAARPTTKASGKTNAGNRKATTTATTMEGYYSMTKPSALRVTKSKPSTSQRPLGKASGVDPIPARRAYEEEDCSDAAIPPPLPKSSRPLELLRAKSKPSVSRTSPPSKLNSKSTTAPRYEEEESSSGSLPVRLSGSKQNKPSGLHFRPARSAPKVKNKPLFVDVSDTDSDIEASEVQRPLSGTTAVVIACDEGEAKIGSENNDVRISLSLGETRSTLMSKTNRARTIGGVIDLTVKRNASKSKGTPMTLMPAARPGSVPLDSDLVDSTPISRSPLKLDHILLSQSALDSEEGESEEDELPMFHHGPARPGTTKATNTRPAARPFPIQFASESPASACTSRLKEWNGKRRDENDDDDDDGVKIVDVFTTPRGPSPPRSPTPSPSPVRLPPAYASAGPSTSTESRQLDGFPISPTKSSSVIDAEPHKKTKQRRHGPSESDTSVSGHETNGIIKSPRRSTAHSSPRHVARAYGRAPSPTPLALSNSGPIRMVDTAGRKPRLSDTSAIYISSGSEDEGNPDSRVDHIESGANRDRDECMNRDSDAWADTGMILSTPPSPAPPASDDPVLTVPAVDVALPNPVCGSKFRPAPAAATKVDARSQASNRITSTSLKGTTSDKDTFIPRTSSRAPLLVARAKRSKRRDDDIIDLTSD